MKIITLHQPWASLVALGLKKYETRHWSTDYRGPLLIHAAKRTARTEELDAVCKHLNYDDTLLVNLNSARQLGVIVAIANLTKCLQMMNGWVETDPPEGFTVIQSKSALEQAVGLWEPGRFALCLDNVRSLPSPISFKSRQGKLLDAPADIVALVNEQLKEVA